MACGDDCDGQGASCDGTHNDPEVVNLEALFNLPLPVDSPWRNSADGAEPITEEKLRKVYDAVKELPNTYEPTVPLARPRGGITGFECGRCGKRYHDPDLTMSCFMSHDLEDEEDQVAEDDDEIIKRSLAAVEEITKPLPKSDRKVQEDVPLRAQVLRKAESLVCGTRNEEYGSPYDSHARIASLWAGYLGVEIKAHDAAIMLALMKASRSRTDKKQDTFDDGAAYFALAYECLIEELNNEVEF